MDGLIFEIIELAKNEKNLDNDILNSLIRNALSTKQGRGKKFSKQLILPYFLSKGSKFWGIDSVLEYKIIKALRVKPRRTASGVATITIMTKPWPCQSACIYCPNDLRMPKSYLADEPVAQRAEKLFFDPYLQVSSRLKALKQMGHSVDKLEIIILGGTFSDYPKEYQIWFVKEVFRALNESKFSDLKVAEISESINLEKSLDSILFIKNSDIAEISYKDRLAFYKNLGIENSRDELEKKFEPIVQEVKNEVFGNSFIYNKLFNEIYNTKEFKEVSNFQKSSIEELETEQKINETKDHRCVGLVVETRPDTINTENLTLVRKLGTTKIQIGIQSLNDETLKFNERNITVDKIAQALNLIRLFGFKIHIHIMMNLYKSDLEKDKEDYIRLVQDQRFLPDEAKLYPCVLVDSSKLRFLYKNGEWNPYSEEELTSLLAFDIINTPRFMRISRMIRDISAHDIVAGNKKGNLREDVEKEASSQTSNDLKIQEIRFREIGTEEIDSDELKLVETKYETSWTTEYFLEWVTKNDKIAGFLRLSLPKSNTVNFDELPINPGEAMIREVHIYGKVSSLRNKQTGVELEGTQHIGLGKKLIERAEKISKNNNFSKINVISAIGTREYYRPQGFRDNYLYLTKEL